MEQTKLSQEEITQLTQIQTEQETLAVTFGQIEYSIQSLELQKEKLIERLENLKQTEIEIGKTLSEKYGEGSIDLESGTFTKNT
jgi:stress response protein YsnF